MWWSREQVKCDLHHQDCGRNPYQVVRTSLWHFYFVSARNVPGKERKERADVSERESTESNAMQLRSENTEKKRNEKHLQSATTEKCARLPVACHSACSRIALGAVRRPIDILANCRHQAQLSRGSLQWLQRRKLWLLV